MPLHKTAASTVEAIAAEFSNLPESERANAQRAAFHLHVLVQGMAKRDNKKSVELAASAQATEGAMAEIGTLADAAG